ncbi:uncharacterized protein BdWA1_003744 [Babesia duncani]|uniref:Uncharacterized protein n=1 Tax=Babesia duncani TaxID=323732 RepID=A0AAD9PH65_9APIC|nr:hypothetical protein BdWA1_003744 [Babesia duncani]
MVFSLTGINKDIKREWNSGPQVYYHLLWLMFIPYLGLGLMFFWALHHPNAKFAITLKFGIWGGILTCVYYFFVENLVNIGFGCPWGHAFTGAGGLYRKLVQLGTSLDDEDLEKLIKELVNTSTGDGQLKELGSADKVTEALGKSGLSEKHKNVYANAFKVVFNKVRTYDPSPSGSGSKDLEDKEPKKLKDSAKGSIEGKVNEAFSQLTGLNDLSSDQKKEFKSECAKAYFNAYNTAVEVDSGLSIDSKNEDQIKEELNKALSSKSLQLSAAQVAAYARAAFAKQSAEEAKKLYRIAVGAVAAAEHAGQRAVGKVDGFPGDIPASLDPSKAAGYVMNFTNCLTNTFGVLTGFLIKAHLANYLNCSRKLAEGHVFPTASMNGFRSCWFWFSCASSGAWKNFISMFSLDIKEMLLSNGDESKLKELINALVDGTGGLQKLNSGEESKVTAALGSDLSNDLKTVYANAFKEVFNKIYNYNPGTSSDLEGDKLTDAAKGNIKNNLNIVFSSTDGLSGLSDDQKKEFKSACAQAYFDAYNTAVEVDKDLSIDSKNEDQIKEELNKALSSKSLQLSAAQVAAYARAAFAKQSADETAKKLYRIAVGAVAAAEHAGQRAVGKVDGFPGDIPASLDPSKAAGYVMNFTNCLTNSFGVLTGFLIKAHLANYLNCSRKLAEGHVFPTASMNGFRSCWFWFSCASSGAWKNFISMFSLDIKEMLLSNGDESKLKELINALVDGTGGLQKLNSGEESKVTAALGSDLSNDLKTVYANAFKEVFNKIYNYNPGTSSDLEGDKLKETAKGNIKNNLNIVFSSTDGLSGLSDDQKKEFKSACAQAYFDAYNTAVEVDKDLSIDSKNEDQIKEELNKALSSKSLQLSAAQVAAYAKAAFAKQSADETAKKLYRIAVGAVAAAEHAGQRAVGKVDGFPGDIPASLDPSKAAGYVMNFTNCLTNSFGVLTGFLIKAHLANYLNCSRKLAEGHVFPTASMNGFRSCWFWFSCASSGAWKNFISMFSLDIKEMLLSNGDESKLKELINALVDGTGGLQKLNSGEESKVTAALGSDLSNDLKTVYANAFKEVFNKIYNYNPGTSSDLEGDKLKETAKGNIKNNLNIVFSSTDGLSGLSDDQKKEFKSACAQAYFDAYNTAVEVDKDLSIDSKNEDQIKEELNKALSSKSLQLSAAQVAAYAKAAKKATSKKQEAGRIAVGVVAAAELAGCIAVAGPADVTFVG